MDETLRQTNDPRPDPLAVRSDQGGADGFARREAGVKRDAADADRLIAVDGVLHSHPVYPIRGHSALWAGDYTSTLDSVAGHRRRFVAAGGIGRRFDSLQLLAASRSRANRILNTLLKIRGFEERAAKASEVVETIEESANEADSAGSKGRLLAFGRLLWPFGPPMR